MARDRHPPQRSQAARPDTTLSDEELAAAGEATLSDMEARVADELRAREANRARAVIKETSDMIVCRPDPKRHISTAGPVVISNWIGTFKGKSCRVFHGTPASDLEPELLEHILETRGMRVGAWPPKPEAAPQP